MATCMVTCGRGLDHFVKQEIREKIPNISKLKQFDEGKIAIDIDLATTLTMTTETKDIREHRKGPKDTTEAEEGQNSTEFPQQQNTAVGDRVLRDKTTMEEDRWVAAVTNMFKLKLVERVFTLIHCEDIDAAATTTEESNKNMNILREYEKKFKYLVENVRWDNFAMRLRKVQQHQQGVSRVWCLNPDSCPGSLRKNTERKLLAEKRSVNTSLREAVRTSVTCNSDGIAGENFQDRDYKWRKRKRKKVTKKCEMKSSEKPYSVREEDDSELQETPKNSIKENNHTLDNSEHSIENTFETNKLPDVTEGQPVIQRGTPTVSGHQANVVSVPALDPERNNSIEQAMIANSCEGEPTYRVSSRLSGPLKHILTVQWVNHTLSHQLNKVKTTWVLDCRTPLLDLFVNITATHFIVGVSLSPRPLSLRSYVPHLTLRSTISHLMAWLAHIPPKAVVLDLMCGGGSILLEAAKNFNVGHVIASDSSEEQLEVARCNLHSLQVPVSLLQADAKRLPLQDSAINTVLCDFPFGKKHKLAEEERHLLAAVLKEIHRLLVCGGRAVFLLSATQHQVLPHLTNNKTKPSTNTPGTQHNTLPDCQDDCLSLVETYLVSLGVTAAYLAVMVKEHPYHKMSKEEVTIH